METILDIFALFWMMFSITMGIIHYAKMVVLKKSLEENHKKIYLELNLIQENIGNLSDEVIEISSMIEFIKSNLTEIQRSKLALRDDLEPTKPMKPNNWNSMREAFKGPIRNDVNERD